MFIVMSWRLGKRGKIFTQLLTVIHWQSKYSLLLYLLKLFWKCEIYNFTKLIILVSFANTVCNSNARIN